MRELKNLTVVPDPTLAAARIAESTILTLADVEKAHIEAVLKQCNFNIERTSNALGIARATLYRKLESYQISRRG